ncbi:MAG TPA: hypothetical protein VF017_15645 [Thermoanaerobaculia bacterium]|nr:hypothetical protein [Thermoanaerobaculia bacterium]
MFEQALQTKEWREQRDLEGRSDDEIKGRRLAAILLVTNVVVGTGVSLLVTGSMQSLALFVTPVLAFYLYKLRPRAENLVTALTIISAVLAPVICFAKYPLLTALALSVENWGVTGPLLLLLLGVPSPARRLTAVAIFVVVTGSLSLLALAAHFANPS